MTIIQKGGKMGRLLDEDDVVDWLLKRTEMYDATGHFVDENVVKKNIESQIAKIPSAQPEQQWIPCSEMPDTDRNVFIARGTPESMTVCVGHYQHDYEQWYEDRNWFATCLHDGLYWCEMPPLPEPYKGGRDADR